MWLLLQTLCARPGGQVHVSSGQMLAVADVGTNDLAPSLGGSQGQRSGFPLPSPSFWNSNTAPPP